MPIAVAVARTTPRDVAAVGVPVGTAGPVPRSVGLGRAALAAHGFEGKVGQTLVVPAGSGATVVAVGIGDPADVAPATLRNAAAALARAAAKHASLATALADVGHLDARSAAQAVVEGLRLASYRYTRLKKDAAPVSLERVVLVGAPERVTGLEAGARRGTVVADAVCLARDLANDPPNLLTAREIAHRAVELGKQAGFAVEVMDEAAIAEGRLGGLMAVNQGSTEPARLVKLTWSPRNPVGTVALVGKGVMYDSGGISLKPSDGMHAYMKMDMSGAAAVLATFTAVAATKPKVKVVGYMACTDNMPSGSAQKLGDVLTVRNGKTVEVLNTDAEGRLILADALCLAVEDGADAIIDIATLTGAVMAALGTKLAGVMGNNQSWVDQVLAAGKRTDEQVWQLPLPPEYRKQLDSEVADLKNIGGPYGGALNAGLFLQEFVGDTPWAHLDMAGTMRAEADDAWLTKGATAFGVRLFLDLLDGYQPPA
ncbi:MAG TPA: leucyl aminopeptidase [Acidimicrobiales bacterium]